MAKRWNGSSLGTASGITFLTLEDETGFVNLVVHLQVFERFAAIGKTQNFLGITGRVQRVDDVVHVVVSSLWVPKVRVRPMKVESRDFH